MGTTGEPTNELTLEQKWRRLKGDAGAWWSGVGENALALLDGNRTLP